MNEDLRVVEIEQKEAISKPDFVFLNPFTPKIRDRGRAKS
jgi:hypothetical protein